MDGQIRRGEELLSAVPIPPDAAIDERHRCVALVVPVGQQC
jgi:hypothetical protein